MARSGEAGSVAEVQDGVDYGVGVTPRHSGLRDFWRLCKPNVMQLVIFTSAVAMFVAPGHVHPLLGFAALI